MNGPLDLREITKLTEEQCSVIYEIAKNLQIIADLSQADIFIDCLIDDTHHAAIVVAEANPRTTQSLYKNSVVGEIAYEDAEPGVLFSLKTGKPVIGSRGISQENVVMQQDIIPIKDGHGSTVAVLIKERDISQEIQAEQKVRTLMNTADYKEKENVFQTIVIQEIHHRVKNNLQVIASLLRLQMRRSSSEEAVEVFSDSILRISSMATVHDYLAQHGIEEVDAKFVMEQISALIISLSRNREKCLNVTVQGESLFLPSDIATSVSLVVNELVQNCIKHAFPYKNAGLIDITVKSRKQMAYITVADNGQGLDERKPDFKTSSLGLQLVQMLVEEKLHGELSFFHSDRGTKVSITFPIPDRVM